MAVEPKPSEVLGAAAETVAADPQGTVRVTVAGREVGTEPLAEWLRQAARTYAVYDGRGWPTTRVDERVSRADQAALRFAHTLLDAQHPTDADPQPDSGVDQAEPASRPDGSE
jgi:hypothetical protein